MRRAVHTICVHLICLTALWAACLPHTQAQVQTFAGIAPAFSLTDPLHKKFELSCVASSEIRLGDQRYNGMDYPSKVLQFYGQGLLSYDIDSHWQLGAGYGFQRNDPFLGDWQNEQRSIQQVFFSTRLSRLHLYSRMRLEERWFSYPSGKPQQGTRARLLIGAMKFSRQNNFYWNIYAETLAITSGQRNAFIGENWLYGGIGFRYASSQFVELGIGYDSVVTDSRGGLSGLVLLQVTCIVVLPGPGMKTMSPVMHGRHF